jgi:putative ABC transport system permease protein
VIDYLRTLLLFYRGHLRVQPLRELMAVAGVAAGVALLFAVQVAHHSITGSFEEISHGVAGTRRSNWPREDPKASISASRKLSNVCRACKAAAPILTQPVVAVGPTGPRALTLVGATEQVSALHGRLSSQFQRAPPKARSEGCCC